MTNTAKAAQMLDDLQEILDAKCAKHGTEDWTYISPTDQGSSKGSCLYVHTTDDGDKEPGCIIGQWLFYYRGVSLPMLESRENDVAKMIMMKVLPDECGEGNVSGKILMDVAMTVQGEQDARRPWSEAIAKGRSTLESYQRMWPTGF